MGTGDLSFDGGSAGIPKGSGASDEYERKDQTMLLQPLVLAAESQDILTINIWQILISLCNLLLIFLILKKFLFGPVQKVFAERQKVLDDTVEETNAANARAHQQEARYAEKLSKADEESQRRIQSASEIAKSESDRILAAARADADAMMKSAREQIQLDQKKADAELRREMTDLSTAIAEKVIEREVRPEDHDRMIRDFIEELDRSSDD